MAIGSRDRTFCKSSRPEGCTGNSSLAWPAFLSDAGHGLKEEETRDLAHIARKGLH